MTLEVEAWVTVFGVGLAQPYVFSGYVLDIVGESSSNGIAEDNVEHWTLFPNPADDQLTLQGLPGNSVIRVFNIAGQEMQVQADLKSGAMRTISTATWAEGIYFVVAESTNQVVTQRLVVQH